MACTIGGAAPKAGSGPRKGQGKEAGDGMNGDGNAIRNHAPLPVGSRLHQTHTKGLRADARSGPRRIIPVTCRRRCSMMRLAVWCLV